MFDQDTGSREESTPCILVPSPSLWQKELFELAFADAQGRAIERKRRSRRRFIRPR